MKINEITESLYDYITGLKQQKTQNNWNRGNADKSAYMDKYQKGIDQANTDYRAAIAKPTRPAQATPTQVTPVPNSIFLVTGPGGMEYFKTQNNRWFEKPDPHPNNFSTLGSLAITDPVKTNALEKILDQKRQTVFIKPSQPGDTVNFVSDPAGQSRAERSSKLAASRTSRKNTGVRQ